MAVTANYNSTAKSYALDFTSNALVGRLIAARKQDANAFVAITALKWNAVKVKLVGDATLGTPNATLATTGTNAFPSAITIDTNKYAGNATWTVSGAKDGTNALTGSFAVNAGTIPGSTWVADGTGYVTVTISDLTANSAAKNTITGLSAVDLTKPDGTKLTGGLTFAVVDNTGAQLGDAISNGTWVSAANSDNAYIKLTAANSTGAVASWDVVVKVTPVGGTAQNYTVSVPDNGSATIRSMFPMDKSYTVEVVSATAVEPLTIENQTWNNDTGILTLTFNKDVRTGFGKNNVVCTPNTVSAQAVQVNGKTLTIEFAMGTTATGNITVNLTNVTDDSESASATFAWTAPAAPAPITKKYSVGTVSVTGLGAVTTGYTVKVTDNAGTVITEIAPGATYKIEVVSVAAVAADAGTGTQPSITVTNGVPTAVTSSAAGITYSAGATCTASGHATSAAFNSFAAGEKFTFTFEAPSAEPTNDGDALTMPAFTFVNGQHD